MDMIPGRMNRLALEPVRPGTYRGACAEFCGMAHARMNLVVVVHEPPAFEAWLDAQAAPAAAPATPVAQRGQAVFFERGCLACHTIRGTAAVGVIGPDLTHLGSRQTIAAGTLPQQPNTIRRWIAEVDRIKPGAHMPTFGALPAADLDALAAFLSGLR
jgi:cytochrome c oxidase subunit 2